MTTVAINIYLSVSTYLSIVLEICFYCQALLYGFNDSTLLLCIDTPATVHASFHKELDPTSGNVNGHPAA